MTSTHPPWSIEEARRRTTGPGSAIKRLDELRRFLIEGRLIAWGTNATTRKKEPIQDFHWKELSTIDLKNSYVSSNSADSPSYREIELWPTVLAPNAGAYIGEMSLKAAFRKFILDDPEVQKLGVAAIKEDVRLRRVYEEGRCYPFTNSLWPVVFDIGQLAGGRSPDTMIGSLSDDEVPRAVQVGSNVIGLRYAALLALLGTEFRVTGDPVRPGETPEILPSVWSNRRYYLDAGNGDLYSFNEQEPDSIDELFVARCRALHMTYKGFQQKAFVPRPADLDEPVSEAGWRAHSNLTKGEQVILRVLGELFPSGLSTIKSKERDVRIRQYLKSQKDLSEYSDQTIKRCLAKVRFFENSSG